MVEFALGATILVTVFVSVFQFGYMFYQYNALQNAVTNGAHFGSQFRYSSITSTPDSTFSNAVKNMVVYGDPTGATTTPVLRNLSATNVNITMGTSAGGVSVIPTSVTVDVSGYTINGLFGTYACTNKPTFTYAYQGIFAPNP